MQLIKFYFSIFILFALSSEQQIQLKEVRPFVERLIQYHVDCEGIDSKLVSYSLSNFINSFDPTHTCLLQSDIEPYTNLSHQRSGRILADFMSDNLATYVELNDVIIAAVARARLLRNEMYSSLTLSDFNSLVATDIYDEKSFPNTTQQLKDRMYSKLQAYIDQEKRVPDFQGFSEKHMKRSIVIFERMQRRHEDKYCSSSATLPALIIKSYAHSLDSHTDFFSKEEAKAMRVSLKKQAKGIGIVMRESGRGTYISAVLPGSPAEKAEIRKGDIIVGVNGNDTTDSQFQEISKLMSTSGDVLTLSLVSPSDSNEVRNVTLQREEIALDDGRVKVTTVAVEGGVIVQAEFSSFYCNGDKISVEQDLRRELKKVEKTDVIKGIVIDLRRNPGGFLSQAVKVCGLFVPKGIIAVAAYKGGDVQYNRDFNGVKVFSGPIVVLTSKGSASASEVVAQCLKDYGAAVIVGDKRTYGKGSMQIQTVMDENAEAYFKVTVGRYYTVSGASPQLVGVSADIVAPTKYDPYDIGEELSRNPIPRKELGFSLLDHDNPLANSSEKARALFKHYLPKKDTRWAVAMPHLKRNSEKRVALPQYKEFIALCSQANKGDVTARVKLKNYSDMPLIEATSVVKDMIEWKRNNS